MSIRGAARTGLTEVLSRNIIEGFKVEGTERFDEYGIELVSLTHEETGAKYFHVDTEDTNNAFCVGFCTPAKDDTGVAHILEHTTLCGSEKYPVKDPFFKMKNRSLSTFMNAMTYPDTTMYPFATVNERDFGNLRSVYLDAVFFPRLSSLDFLQEGHRLEKDEEGNLKIKGVVFNEMKGIYGDPSNLFYHKTIIELYGRGSCYGHHYGGLPASIPDLTHDDLVAFHKAHYSPANCTIASYGDLPLVESLSEANQVLLRRLENDAASGSRKLLSVFGEEAKSSSTRRYIESTGPTDALMTEEETGVKFSISWALDIPTDTSELNFSFAILSVLLTSGPNAPLYQALVEAGVGSDFTMGTGYAGEYQGGCFQAGVQGADLEKHSAEEIERIIMTCLSDTVKNGFEKARVESVLHQVELSKTQRSANWGINVVTGLVHSEVHGKQASAAFEATLRVKELRERLEADPTYLQKVLDEQIVKNERKLVHLMRPNEEYAAKTAKEEEEVLTPAVIKRTPAEAVCDKVEFAKELDVVEDLSVLPTLLVERDIPVEPLPDPEIQILQHDKLELFQNVITPTNGVWYLRLLLPINHLTRDELLLLPLLCSLVGGTGAGGFDYRELSQEIELCCSGITAQAVVGTDRKETDKSNAMLVISSYGLERNWERFFEVLSLVLTDARWDSEDAAVRLQVQSIIAMSATESVNSVVDSAHAYALRHAAAQVDKHANCTELVTGLTQVAYLKDLKTTSEESLTPTIDALRSLYNKLFAAYGTLRASLTTSAPLTPHQLTAFNTFLETLPDATLPIPATLTAADEPTTLSPTGKVFIPSPADLGYIGMAMKTDLSFLHENMAAAEVMLRIVESKFLHKEVREKGGAYGSGTVSSSAGNDSILGMYSYRDPATGTTEDTFGRCLAWLEKEESVKDEDVNEAKLQVFSGADAPKSPQFQGLREFLSTITMDEVRTKRSRLLATSREDILRVARLLFQPSWINVEKSSSGFYATSGVVVGGDAAWDVLREKDPKWVKWEKLDDSAGKA